MSSITIKGVDELIAKLGKASSVDILKPPMERSVMRLQRDMADYPEQRTGSSYVRTGTLGRRWTTKVTRSGGGLVGTVGNNTSYGPFVQSHQFQAKHMSHWPTDMSIMDANRKSIVSDFERAIAKALK